MNCRDVLSKEWTTAPTPVDIVESWIVAAQANHLKVNGKLLSIEECTIVKEVLRVIIGDLELLK
jgi:hypothetical protein